MRYLPHTPEEIDAMLQAIGVPSIDRLFDPIPKDVQLGRELAIPTALDEASLMAHLSELADRNVATRALSFLGGGIYDHHVPPKVDQLLLRGEFYTAYTPYQAEVAQGTLQAIFEFQTIVSESLQHARRQRLDVRRRQRHGRGGAHGAAPDQAVARARERGRAPGVPRDHPHVRPGPPWWFDADRARPARPDGRRRSGRPARALSPPPTRPASSWDTPTSSAA